MKKINVIIILCISLLTTGCYDFNRQQNELDAESQGKAILLEAESSKKAAIEEAKAKKESATLYADAKIIEAEGNARAIKIISEQLKNNPEYLQYLLIDGLNKVDNKVYIPTEAGVPILEVKQ